MTAGTLTMLGLLIFVVWCAAAWGLIALINSVAYWRKPKPVRGDASMDCEG